MKRRLLAYLIGVSSISIVISGCHKGVGKDTREEPQESTWAYEEVVKQDMPADMRVYKSDQGYRISFDAARFHLKEGNGVEMFMYDGETSGVPVYVSFMTMEGEKAAELASSLSDHLGEVKTMDAVGANGLTGFQIEKVAADIQPVLSYCIFQNGNNVLLVEAQYATSDEAEMIEKICSSIELV